jgi:hypothetical protein
MKDAKHHLKHLQKKVIQSSKKEGEQNSADLPQKEERVVNFRRPKTIQNKRKIA